ncbi:TPA: type I methionyl aminopeptidase [Candidatus Uhrbacteria bacterium]|uniref:Methionine aminopeptidase n=2 Tax=Candidatus Uhriibacteriota TaxID=1752732 RepID=A0A0G1SGK4_9BACT|nr:MAG: Methionine aminopeptidase [Candidatus Uhrbacteria bacterium GW2011_GWF2_46_218]KKU41203.1 MAG: Methionine aminopeptidase [Candidatus Uhrbacteria bacterium GW2011_GWE2_46_68]HBK34051.1 type I methionyl aminopeptidase [Candidatus Uhrbacteria bacterium]HCB18871.1 type I methionyl aminopeptidase [Candidatus Uhrbacteria bacterium]
MALIKTTEEIDRMRRGGFILSQTMKEVISIVQPGLFFKDLDMVAKNFLTKMGATPSFQGYQSSPEDIPFPSALCVSINEEVVHGLGNRERRLQEGDVVGLDLGCWFEGMCTDMAVTVGVGKISHQAEQLIRVTQEALFHGVSAARAGQQLSCISQAIESAIRPYGYGIVEALGGHGVGHDVHEPPYIPNFTNHHYKDVTLTTGMCLALEPMVGLGSCHVRTAEDGWAVLMEDCQISAHAEVTIVIQEEYAEILTPFPL